MFIIDRNRSSFIYIPLPYHDMSLLKSSWVQMRSEAFQLLFFFFLLKESNTVSQ